MQFIVKHPSGISKIKTKKIKFGVKGKDDFIDHKNANLKRTLLKRLKKVNHVLYPNFWRKHLLNGNSTNMTTNFSNVL